MAHFAEIDAEGTVLRVLVVPDEQEHRGQDFLADDLKLGGTWIQTSYNGNIRRRYAGVGMLYLAEHDAFVAAQPYPSWLLDAETLTWQPPVPMPAEGFWVWDEDAGAWVDVGQQE